MALFSDILARAEATRVSPVSHVPSGAFDILTGRATAEDVGVAPTPMEDGMTPNGRRRLVLDESSGRDYLTAYKDSKGIPTIGHGFNLDAASNADVFKQVTGLTVDEAKAGAAITKAQQDALLNHTIARAEADARMLVPGFDKLPSEAQDAIGNFVFNVGYTTASKFKSTLAAINRGDGAAAADSILKSQYAKQVGSRAQRVADGLRTIGPH